MNSLAVGGILKRLYDEFDMQSFSNRLKLQKIIYLLQTKGINLGYSYSWYIYGPYSTGLTRDAYNISDFSKFKAVGFADAKDENTFQDFVHKIKNKSEFWMEVAASIHFLKKIYPNKSKAQIVNDIRSKRQAFNNKQKQIARVWQDIEGWII